MWHGMNIKINWTWILSPYLSQVSSSRMTHKFLIYSFFVLFVFNQTTNNLIYTKIKSSNHNTRWKRWYSETKENVCCFNAKYFKNYPTTKTIIFGTTASIPQKLMNTITRKWRKKNDWNFDWICLRFYLTINLVSCQTFFWFFFFIVT